MVPAFGPLPGKCCLSPLPENLAAHLCSEHCAAGPAGRPLLSGNIRDLAAWQ
jgi:hypothetical protein